MSAGVLRAKRRKAVRALGRRALNLHFLTLSNRYPSNATRCKVPNLSIAFGKRFRVRLWWLKSKSGCQTRRKNGLSRPRASGHPTFGGWLARTWPTALRTPPSCGTESAVEFRSSWRNPTNHTALDESVRREPYDSNFQLLHPSARSETNYRKHSEIQYDSFGKT